jgi:hypothetical protein
MPTDREEVLATPEAIANKVESIPKLPTDPEALHHARVPIVPKQLAGLEPIHRSLCDLPHRHRRTPSLADW